MDGLSLVPLLLFGCLGELGKLNLSHSALHPLRRRANSARKDAPRFTTLSTTASAPGALLLSSYLLVHLLIPRMRSLNMDPSAENAVCLHRDASPSLQRLVATRTRWSTETDKAIASPARPSDRDCARPKFAVFLPRRRQRRRQQLRAFSPLPTPSTMHGLKRSRGFPRNAHTPETVRIAAWQGLLVLSRDD